MLIFSYFKKSYQVWLSYCTGRLFHLILVYICSNQVFISYIKTISFCSVGLSYDVLNCLKKIHLSKKVLCQSLRCVRCLRNMKFVFRWHKGTTLFYSSHSTVGEENTMYVLAVGMTCNCTLLQNQMMLLLIKSLSVFWQ